MSPFYVSDSGGGSFTPHPEGQYAAVCVDVVDVGWVKTQYGPKYKARVVFFCGEWTKKEIDGEQVKMPLLVFSTFTATLSERGNLRPFLEAWRGKMFTADELGKFDLENLLHAPAFLQVVHRLGSNGNTYANVKTIMKLPPNMTAPTVPAEYQRAKDREGWEGPAPHPDAGRPQPHDHVPQDTNDYSDADSDMPF